MSSKGKKSGATKSRAIFTEAETLTLLTIWSSEKVQQLFKKSLRHNLIWDAIADKHSSKGYSKSAAEVKSKINNLKTEYRNIKPKSGSATPTWPYFEILHKVLGERDCVNDDLLDDSMNNTQDSEDYVESDLANDELIEDEASSIDQINCDSVNESEEDSMDVCGNSPVNEKLTGNVYKVVAGSASSKDGIGERTAKKTTKTEPLSRTPNRKTEQLSGTPNQKQTRKIARPSRKKGSDEHQLIKTLIESEKRYCQRLANLEEQEKKSQEREDFLAQSMNRFLTAFAVLAENNVGSGTTSLDLQAASGLGASKVTTKGQSSKTLCTSCPVMNNNDSKASCSVSKKSKLWNNFSVPPNVNDVDITHNDFVVPKTRIPSFPSMQQLHISHANNNTLKDFGNQSTYTSVLPSMSTYRKIPATDDEIIDENEIQTNYNDFANYVADARITNEDSPTSIFSSIAESPETFIEDLDEDNLPSVPWLQPAEPQVNVTSIQELVGKQRFHVKNLEPMKPRNEAPPLKTILQVTQLDCSEKSQRNITKVEINEKSSLKRKIHECNVQQLSGRYETNEENLQPSQKCIGHYPSTNIFKIPKKASIQRKSDGLIYITRPKD